jgi:hypothetical protein
MQINDCQLRALKEVDRYIFQKKHLQGKGHVHDSKEGEEIINGKTIKALKNKGMVVWTQDESFGGEVLKLTDKGIKTLHDLR